MTIKIFQGEYEFLSNFFPCDVKYDRIIYPTAEHAFQAQKSEFTNDRISISKIGTPGQAKRAGSKLTLCPHWNNKKLGIMRDIVRIKFKNVHLARKLIDTDPHDLIEGNNWNDRYWGVCKGQGLNRLGIILMDVREDLVRIQISGKELLVQLALGTFDPYRLADLVATSDDTSVLTAAAKFFCRIKIDADGPLADGAYADTILNAFMSNEFTPDIIKEYVMLARQIKSLENCRRDKATKMASHYYNTAKAPLERNFDLLHKIIFEYED